MTARGLALGIGGLGLLNLAAGYDANLWWIDARALGPAGDAVVVSGSAALLLWAVRPNMSRPRRRASMLLVLALLGIATANAINVWRLMSTGALHAGNALPFSALVAAILLAVLVAMAAPPSDGGGTRRLRRVGVAAAAVAFIALFALGQMLTFGRTDYRRPADAAVVFGARTFSDGRLSLALADRVRTAAALYRQGLVGRLIMSGGPGDGAVHETEAMRRYAMELGVAREHILIDRQGLSTRATVAEVSAMRADHHLGRLIAVSHFYHLPRIKMAFQQAGMEVLTVPASESRPLARLPWYLAREVAAWWAYYARGFIA